jgi:hypothetical protein
MPAILPSLSISSPGDDCVVDFENIQAYKKARLAMKLSQALRDHWLASERDW